MTASGPSPDPGYGRPASLPVCCHFGLSQDSSGAGKPPHLEKRGAAIQLIVDDKPFLILGGELHNSSSSSVEYMKPIWPRLAGLHLNTSLVPVAWETVEPREGSFDFRCVDGLLRGARENHLRLVILWFGAWKNTYSSYTPAWVKTDLVRFPRVQTSTHQNTERESPFSKAMRDADARAFAQLMRHLREVDGTKHTVLMVQVENEVGVIPESRDHSATAEAAFNSQVPAALTSYLERHRSTLNPALREAWESAGAKKQGSWREVFGDDPLTDDLFMAWQFASYIEEVARAGKHEYALPMFVNAALIRQNYQPGQYNSGGPLPHSINVWRAASPSIDLFSPDIYFNDFVHWATAYKRADNPLFIPETQGGPAGAANAFFAFGGLSAIGFSPFGRDDEKNAPLDLAGIPTLRDTGDKNAIGGVYGELADLSPQILEAQRNASSYAALIEGSAQRAARLKIGGYTATIVRADAAASSDARIGVMFLQTGPDEFIVAGGGDAQVTFSTEKAGPPVVAIESIDEETFDNGTWVPGRRLNGDESSQGQALRLRASDSDDGRIYRVRLYRHE